MSIPLVARMTKGFDYLLAIARRQRAVLTQEASDAERGAMPAETRIEIDHFRKAEITFTEEMHFPEGHSDSLYDDVNERRRLARVRKRTKKDKDKDKDQEQED